MKRNYLILLSLFINCQFFYAQQIDCEKINSFLTEKETKIANLNLQNPDYIPLHFLIAKDIAKELTQFRKDVIPFFTSCDTITFGELINRFDALTNTLQIKSDSLSLLNKKVYLIFYELALNEYQFNSDDDADYYLQRSLQYNDTFPNAILLKLNKLLKKDRFEECLSLLNTLYYDTQMDREQEMQAIEFTDHYYGKLYFTADSLVKIDHAAEALELFEILEIFCLNLPSAYCNDDYFHGLLRSKSGIYESYLAIAKVAEKRGNSTISSHFYRYAQEYLETNSYLRDYEPKPEDTIGRNDFILEHADPLQDKEIVVANSETPKIVPELKGSAPEAQSVVLQPSPKELKEKYDTMVLQALALCITESFSESYYMFLEAKKLEDCRCFKTDFRVELMITELEKIVH